MWGGRPRPPPAPWLARQQADEAFAAVQGDRPTKPMPERLPESSRYPTSVIPSQVIIHIPKGTNNKVALPLGTSLYDLKQPQMPPPTDLTARDGLLLFSPAAALIRASETLFKTNPIEIRVVLSSIPDAAEVLRPLLDGGRSVVAGRLAAAFRHIGRSE